MTRELCNRLIDGFIDAGRADAAADYAQQIPARVIALTLGVPRDMADTFTGWVRDVLEFAHDEERRTAGRDAIAIYLMEKMEERRTEPGDDLISVLLHTEVDGEPVPDIHVLGTVAAHPRSPASTRPGRASVRRCGTWRPTIPTTAAWWPSPS